MNNNYNVLLADDDTDDCLFFREVLDELPINTTLQTVNNGINLMQHLSDNTHQLPQVLFLDLNMPLKNGNECLAEIKKSQQYTELKVIIISTSMNMDVVNVLYQNGADYYICKPGEFSKLKQVIHNALIRTTTDSFQRPSRAEFVLE